MNCLTAPAPAWATSTGLLLVRLALGAAFILHGWPKVQNPTGWMNALGMGGTPGVLQAAAAFIEFGGGILLLVGLLTRIAALLLAAQMVAALALVHVPHGDPFVASGRPSAELAVVYLAVMLAVTALGAGAYSLDAVLFARRRDPAALRAAGFSPAVL
jgi:putative oxidoreductase